MQTSAMDCGPAALSALLEGFGVRASYGRLREACQTEVDGTSIDSLEDILKRVGFDAEQLMVPVDHLLVPEAQLLPAILVVRLPDGMTHFVVAWRVHGPFVQIMDPAVGRRFVRAKSFLRDLYTHATPVPAEAWREWAGSNDLIVPLEKRMRSLRLDPIAAKALISECLADQSHRSIAALDACVRLMSMLTKASPIDAESSSRMLLDLLARAKEEPSTIPARFWCGAPLSEDEDGTARVELRGAVLIRVRGKASEQESAQPALPAELAAALSEPRFSPLRTLLAHTPRRTRVEVAFLSFVAAATALVALLEAMLARALIDSTQTLRSVQQRFVGLALVVAFFTLVTLLDTLLEAVSQRVGRRFELSLRMAFLEKVPRLGPRWFRSRPASDLAERIHGAHRLRALPSLGVETLRSALGMVAIGVGVGLVDRPSLVPALLVVAASVMIPLFFQPALREREHKMRTHAGAMLLGPLDALLGSLPIRAHAATLAVRHAHEPILVEWARCARATLAHMQAADALTGACRLGVLLWFLLGAARGGSNQAALLLVTYWILSLGVLGQRFVAALRQYAPARSGLLRLLEPLGAPTETSPRIRTSAQREAERSGMSVALRGVSVVAGGHTLLDDIHVEIAAGEHVAIVGRSGEGKSTLVGTILGLHPSAEGEVAIDGAVVGRDELRGSRGEMLWVDPTVSIWNESVLDNILYGNDGADATAVGRSLDASDLLPVIERLPEGMATTLGEQGRLLSGGEGQRVRLGRGMARTNPRLVVLDEALRGLEPERRDRLLERAREHWSGATLLVVTHDVHDTLRFERVLVVAQGRVAEDGRPSELAANPSTEYARLLAAEDRLVQDAWRSPDWRRVSVRDGELGGPGVGRGG